MTQTFTTKGFQRRLAVAAIMVFTMLLPSLNAQNAGEKVLLTIGNEKISADEFLAIYKKNNVDGEVLDKKSLEEYLELFINFKLKVKEAETLGLDTAASFKNELKGYRDQLAKPYFVDEEVNAYLLQQAYSRKLKDVRVSHILVRVDKYATPEDTLAAYNKIMEIRSRIVGGEDFNEVAAEVSEDPSARDMPAQGYQPPRQGNRGDIGYFTVFDMVLPFEEAAFSMKEGEVSQPVRTEFGYHLLKLQSIRPALGSVQVAHLFLKMPDNATAADSVILAARADSIYKALQAGARWDEMVKELSDDKSSSENGGKLPWFGSNRMVPSFIDGIRSIADTGQISKPVLTSYGWHIIKLVDKKPVRSFEDEKADLKQSLSKDKRSNKSKESIIRRIKQEANYQPNRKALEAFYAVVDSSVYKRKWEADKAAGMNQTIFTLGNQKYNQHDFAAFLAKHQTINSKETIPYFVDKVYNEWVDEQAIAYEDARLEEKYPEFKALVKEYRDGILLFDLTDKMVWSKAISDTTGLQNFYENNKENYLWGKRLKATVITSDKRADVDKALELINNGMSPEEVKEVLVNDKPLDVMIVNKKFSKGDNEFVDKVEWKAGTSPVYSGTAGNFGLVIVEEVVAPEHKTLGEARGLITADYQNYLEARWIEELRDKYPVVVNEKVLNELQK
ncbi:MAG: peptidylprolyl isomerase [Bacteroidales bacterium]|nr:peptidylprolyl isomerase [Bacteroidales bacterium]MDD3525432.1 peptidylprolyl isomerase [Bacteroidales bacterium]MDD4177725.1 peptidylprolyl isomerase [Bacteroidales bacterium]MDY0335072.1 peptidylprolyl isomerase [Bacteroidales bacterium]